MTTQAVMTRVLAICDEIFAYEGGDTAELIERSCGSDHALRDQVLRILQHDRSSTGSDFLVDLPSLSIEPLTAGIVIADRFTLVRHIGSGGSGDVYEADDAAIGGAPVALKILSPLCACLPRAIERFKNEGYLVAKLQHANIVPVLAVGESQGLYYYAMQLIRGQDLAKKIAQWRSEGRRISDERIREIVEIVRQAARGLDYAHEMGLIHRDIKPGNLLLDGKHNVWITDFGLARLRERHTDMTHSHGFSGTLRYMSPEQVSQGRLPIDIHTDLYSLGVTLFEMLALRPPFDDPDPVAMLRHIAEDEPPQLRLLSPGVPRDLETIVRKAMSKEATGRYRSAKELANDLGRFQDRIPIDHVGDIAAAKARLRARLLAAVESAIETLDDWALLEPAVSNFHQGLLEMSVHALANLAESDRGWRVKIADACRRFGEVQRRLGKLKEAQVSLEQALQIIQGALDEDPHDERSIKILARTHFALGVLFSELEEIHLAEKALGECRRLCLEPTRRESEDFSLDGWNTLAVAATLNLGAIVMALSADTSHREIGICLLREAAELSQRAHGRSHVNDATPTFWLVLSLYRLGITLQLVDRFDEARECHQKVLALGPQLTKAVPAPGLGRLLSRSLMSENYMETFCPIEPEPSLEPLYQLAIEMLEQLLTHEVVPEYRVYLGIRHLAYGKLLMGLGRHTDGETQFRHAIRTCNSLVADFGQLPDYCHNLALSETYLARLLCDVGRISEAEVYWKQAIEHREQLFAAAPQISRYVRLLAADHERFADYLEQNDRKDEAVHHRQRSSLLGQKFS